MLGVPKKSATAQAKQLATKFCCEFEEANISSPIEILSSELEPNVEVLGRITLLWENVKKRYYL
jgi:hypothetical protein